MKIKIDENTGVYSVPAKVNGLSLNFIFDTGASNVCISLTEAMFMAKNGYLSEEDIKGTSFSQLADGRVTENTKIKLRKIEIGNIEIDDIMALVVHNMDAPLLLGQSAIRKLGRIEFDGDYLYIYHAESENHKNEIDEIKQNQYQKQIDSLVVLSNKTLQEKDFIMTSKYVKEARECAILSGISNRNWELDYIEGDIKKYTHATTVKNGWLSGMPLYYSAFHSNVDKVDGVAIKFKDLAYTYARGIAYHFMPYDILKESGVSEEEEFTEVISILLDSEDYRYKAYCTCAIFYESNFNVAKKYCERAIEIDSESYRAYAVLGNAYEFTIKDHIKAKDCYMKALTKTDCDSGYVYRLIAWCLPKGSKEYFIYLKKSAQLGDPEAINALNLEGVSW